MILRLPSLVALLATLAAAVPALAAPAQVDLFQKGDRVVFIGNTFAERLALFSYFETLVTTQHPDYQLIFRNLGWSGDTLTLQPRPLNFGSLHDHLKQQKADLIFVCFGLNESFEGEESLPAFESSLRDFIDGLKQRTFNQTSPPRLVILSPIAHQRLDGFLPDPASHNRSLALYTTVMARVAADKGIRFVDLYTPTLAVLQRYPEIPLTFNGIHLTAYGDWFVSQILASRLGLLPGPSRQENSDPKSFREAGELSWSLDSFSALPPPPSPVIPGPRVVVPDLPPGRHALQVDGRTVTVADASEWAQGVSIPVASGEQRLEKLRRKIIEKNQQFFYRWRAVNGEYIYGRRDEPFGVISFPPEMKALDRIVGDLEKEIWELARQAHGLPMRLVPVQGEP